MASKVMSSAAAATLFLSFFALVSSHNVDNLDGYSTTNYENPVFIPPGYPQPQVNSSCNPLKLGVCADSLNGLVDVEIFDVPTQPCCSLIKGLVHVEAALCVCTAIRANVLGIVDLTLPLSLSILFNNCGITPSADYQCTL